MLSKLPFEIACNIVQHLESSELLICSETCQEWRTFIKKRQLIREFDFENVAQFHSLLNAIENQCIDGSQLVTLKIENCLQNLALTFAEFPLIFPNLKTFECDEIVSITTIEHTTFKEGVSAFKAWQNCLEKLAIHADMSEIALLLGNCQFHRLTELNVGYYDLFDDNTRITDEKILTTIGELPQLNSLVLQGEVMTFELLELLHETLPSLKKLELTYSSIPFPEGIPLEIKPAKSITHFAFKVEQFHKNEPYLLQYILAKYPSLVYLHLSHDFNVDPLLMSIMFEVIMETLEPALISFIPQLPSTLKTFLNELISVTKPIINAVEKLSNINEYYLWSDCQLNPDAPTLEYCYSKEIFQSLDRLCITTGYLDDVYPYAGFVTRLKKLDIICDYNDIPDDRNVFYLDRVFKVHPSLQELCIAANGYHTDIDEEKEEEEKKQLLVKELELNVQSVTNGVFNFIRDKMPHLKQLSVLLVEKEDKDDNTEFRQEIQFPDHCLEHLKLTTPYAVDNIVCSVNSIIDDKRKYYHYSKKESKVKYCGMDAVNTKENEDETYFYIDIDCKSIWHLIVNKIRIF